MEKNNKNEKSTSSHGAENKYYIILICGEKFCFKNYKELHTSDNYVALKIQIDRFWLPRDKVTHADILEQITEATGIQQHGRNHLVFHKRMIKETNLDFSKSSSITKKRKRKIKRTWASILGEFMINNNRPPTEAEMEILKQYFEGL